MYVFSASARAAKEDKIWSRLSLSGRRRFLLLSALELSLIYSTSLYYAVQMLYTLTTSQPYHNTI